MSAWGMETFDNDTALDWVADLIDDGESALMKSLDDVLKTGDDYLDSELACCALAASEVLVALAGGSSELPEDAQSWVSEPVSIDMDLAHDKAAQVIDRILAEDSELKELWQESEDDYPAWEECLLNLKQRLCA